MWVSSACLSHTGTGLRCSRSTAQPAPCQRTEDGPSARALSSMPWLLAAAWPSSRCYGLMRSEPVSKLISLTHPPLWFFQIFFLKRWPKYTKNSWVIKKKPLKNQAKAMKRSFSKQEIYSMCTWKCSISPGRRISFKPNDTSSLPEI